VTILTSLVLLDRLKSKLPSRACGSPETCHRVFLAALILANKLLYDVPMKNLVWSECSALYSVAEINLMEKQFLALISFKLTVTEDELWHQYNFIFNHWHHHDAHNVRYHRKTPLSYEERTCHQDIKLVDNMMSEFVDWGQGSAPSLVDNSPTSYLNGRSSASSSLSESDDYKMMPYQQYHTAQDNVISGATFAHPQPTHPVAPVIAQRAILDDYAQIPLLQLQTTTSAMYHYAPYDYSQFHHQHQIHDNAVPFVSGQRPSVGQPALYPHSTTYLPRRSLYT